MTVQALQQAAEARRSIYALNKNIPLNEAEIKQLIEHVVKHSPSAFNSQSTRLLVLFGDEYQKLWDITAECLRKLINDDSAFAKTQERINGFKQGVGTILFYEDQNVVKGLQEQFALYADNFPIWSEHANSLHQYAIWTSFAAAGIGANLQHYNPVIDEAVAKEWNIPENWKLRAQLVFGGIAAPAGEKTYQPIEARIKYAGKL